MNSDVWVWYIWPAIVALISGGAECFGHGTLSRKLNVRH